MISYKNTSQTVSAIAANTNTDSIDLRGYKELAIQSKFATCVGTSNTATVKLQTSNDGVNWADIITIRSEANIETLSGDNDFDYLPDATATALSGFGRYVRVSIAASSWTTSTISATFYFEAKG